MDIPRKRERMESLQPAMISVSALFAGSGHYLGRRHRIICYQGCCGGISCRKKCSREGSSRIRVCESEKGRQVELRNEIQPEAYIDRKQCDENEITKSRRHDRASSSSVSRMRPFCLLQNSVLTKRICARGRLFFLETLMTLEGWRILRSIYGS